jgi:hypothetical protein
MGYEHAKADRVAWGFRGFPWLERFWKPNRLQLGKWLRWRRLQIGREAAILFFPGPKTSRMVVLHTNQRSVEKAAKLTEIRPIGRRQVTEEVAWNQKERLKESDD